MNRTLTSSLLPDIALWENQQTRGSRLLHPCVLLLRLWWLEFRRCGGVWMVALFLPFYWLLDNLRVDQGPVFWFQMSILTFQSYIIIGPLTAGLAAWLVGRDRRRRTGVQIETAPFNPYLRDLALLGAAAAWGLVAYALVGAWYMGQGVIFATWGGPNIAWLSVGALAIVVHAALGFMVERVIRGPFAALIAIVFPVAFAIGVETYRTSAGQSLAPFGDQPLRGLSPFSLSRGLQNDGIIQMSGAYKNESLFWLAGLLGVMLSVILLNRHRSLFGVGVLSAFVVIAGMGARSVMNAPAWYGIEESSVIPFDWSCQVESGVEVCLHPAYEAQLSDTTQGMSRLMAPITGLPGVPNTWQQATSRESADAQDSGVGTLYASGCLQRSVELPGGECNGPWPTPNGPQAVRWSNWSGDYAMVSSLADAIFTSNFGDRNAAQLAVLTALAQDAGMKDPFPWPYGWPSEISIEEGARFRGPNQAEMDAMTPVFNATVQRFTALEPEAQRSWLEANWAALRAGELTLEDLP